MKEQNTAVRRAALAVLYLAVFAAAVMYLRVTISVPAEGDDKLTLNGWLYDMGRMSFWQYALQDLKERLSFFLLKQVRFFPFHYPNAVALLFYRTLASYRLYIIAMTGAAAFLVSRVAAKLSRSNALALGAFGLALAAAGFAQGQMASGILRAAGILLAFFGDRLMAVTALGGIRLKYESVWEWLLICGGSMLMMTGAWMSAAPI